MEDLRSRPLTRQGGTTNEIQQDHNTGNSAQSQRAVILEWLRSAPLTTLQARNELYIMAPAARIFELKAQGHNIATFMVKAGSKKIAQYVLLIGDSNEKT